MPLLASQLVSCCCICQLYIVSFGQLVRVSDQGRPTPGRGVLQSSGWSVGFRLIKAGGWSLIRIIDK